MYHCLSTGIPEILTVPVCWTAQWFNQTEEEMNMNWDRIEGNWEQFKGSVRTKWGKLTDDQIDVIAGKRETLAGKIQESYGITKEETEKQVAAWQKDLKDVVAVK
jgi:uncharacterized protein YjbJ (UPF0337 family)